jgi:hypothetical protein
MQAITKPRNKSLAPKLTVIGYTSIRVIIDIAMVTFGHEHHCPADWFVRP